MLSHPIETQRNLSLLGFIIPGKSVKLRKNEAQRVFKATSVARKATASTHAVVLGAPWHHAQTDSVGLRASEMPRHVYLRGISQYGKIRFTSFDPNVLEWFYAFKSMAVSIRV